VTTSKDNKLRVFDPRASNTPVKVVTAALYLTAAYTSSSHLQVVESNHSGVKPSRISSVGTAVATVGFNKEDRQISLWDITASKPGPDSLLNTQRVDMSSSFLAPFLDEGTGLLFLAGKGDLMYLYEISEDTMHFVNKAQLSKNQSDVCMLPKRFVFFLVCPLCLLLIVFTYYYY
jgi:hypothetical protein